MTPVGSGELRFDDGAGHGSEHQALRASEHCKCPQAQEHRLQQFDLQPWQTGKTASNFVCVDCKACRIAQAIPWLHPTCPGPPRTRLFADFRKLRANKACLQPLSPEQCTVRPLLVVTLQQQPEFEPNPPNCQQAEGCATAGERRQVARELPDSSWRDAGSSS